MTTTWNIKRRAFRKTRFSWFKLESMKVSTAFGIGSNEVVPAVGCFAMNEEDNN